MQCGGRRVSGILAWCRLLCAVVLVGCTERGAGDKAAEFASASAAEGVARQGTVLAGRNHTLALRSDGTVWAWGPNHLGQLGDGSTVTQRLVPVNVPGLSALSVAAGAAHAHVIRGDRGVWSWGDSTSGQLGTGLSPVRVSPVRVW
ncbi:hypothetical protein HUA76_19000 [Myxococcus sp. CA056]|nr:hypothetical protein [Myxococcus sp. CA056]NTX12887.1 hypothetical protein [Myxococcus sp. CA056]